jgi:hypothetical protein
MIERWRMPRSNASCYDVEEFSYPLDSVREYKTKRYRDFGVICSVFAKMLYQMADDQLDEKQFLHKLAYRLDTIWHHQEKERFNLVSFTMDRMRTLLEIMTMK